MEKIRSANVTLYTQPDKKRRRRRRRIKKKVGLTNGVRGLKKMIGLPLEGILR